MKELEKLRDAWGIDKDVVEGQAFDRELQVCDWSLHSAVYYLHKALFLFQTEALPFLHSQMCYIHMRV